MENAIKAYDTYRNLLYAEGGLPENVRHDLNIDDLCERVDYTSSGIGRQYLYHLLCTDKVSEIRDYEFTPLFASASGMPLASVAISFFDLIDRCTSYPFRLVCSFLCG